MALAPPAPYFGGKQRIAQRLVDLLPAHEHYVEPYAGGLSILMAKPPSKLETINDLDQDIMTFWRVLRDRPADLERACALTPHSRAEHQVSRDRTGLDDIERARRVWVSLTQGRGGQLMRTGWRFYLNPAGTSMGMPGYLDGYVDRLAPAAERLHRVSLECRPAIEIIEAYGGSPDTLLYVDPPYLGETRGGRHATNAYVHEMKGEDEHRELAAALHAAAAAVVLSGYPSPLYDDLYADWHVTDISAWTGQGNHGRSSGGARTERLWSNVPLGHQQMFDLEGTA
ncbi:DNA adenine methylase [Occultella gossypii]|uniref:DNA adenine methylase n=1 Tax=Occultella gossypii TaxID=2800820 RepID=A0ABS7SAG3_9MICO|nr:DNA adenine methylase [Occultella gossypii]MBZ2197257.1 DNA adenine methylase [Occultella gossypii]